MQESISIFDSTLRDGAQGHGVSFSIEDKLAAVRLLDQLGVSYIEAGNPGSNPKDQEFFQRAGAMGLAHARLVAFGSTRRKNILPEEDASLRALLSAGTPCCAIFGKAWKFHVDWVLETTPEENLAMIEDSCRFLKSQGKEVIFDAEHFFDGWRDDPSFALAALEAAARGGADLLCLCDTNGGVFPQEAGEIVGEVAGRFPQPIGVHFHEDCGMAVANSVSGVLAGARQVQGTLLGFGERCGNANLLAVIGNLQLKLGYACIPQDRVQLLSHSAREMAAIANRELSPGMPYVGDDAFSHKAGMHADGVLKAPRSFEHIDPYLVGNARRFPASEISGRAVVLEKIRRAFPDMALDAQSARAVLEDMKALEAKGYQFEGADASFQLLVCKRLRPFPPFFQLLYYQIYTGYGGDRAGASATVKVKVGEAVQLMAAEGNGPVNALDRALRKALEVFYPVLAHVKLTDYKVRVLDSKSATAAGVRVFITSSADCGESFTTVGVSSDVVAASWKALEDSMEYLLLRAGRDSTAAQAVLP